MRWSFVILIASAAGCHRAPSCKDAVEQAVGQLRAQSNEAATMIGWCEQQDWSADVRTCVAASKSQPELTACMARDKKAAAADKAREKAQAAVDETTAAAQAAQEKVDKLVKDLADLDGKVAGATGSGSGGGDKVKLDELRKEKADLDSRLAAAKIAAAKAERAKQQAADCQANSSAKGCGATSPSPAPSSH
jgi:hypothetical protein